MKKNLKLKTILFTLITIIFGIGSVSATTAPSTLKIGHHDYSTPIQFPSTFHIAKTTDGKYVYCTDYITKTPVTSVNYTRGKEITDPGTIYILKKGNEATNDNEYFVAQSALWIYLLNKGEMHANNIETYKNTVNNSSNSYAKKIRTLVNEATNAEKYDNSNPTISLNGDIKFNLNDSEDTYISTPITVKSSTEDYNIELNNAPEGTTYSKKNNQITIKVPAKSISNTKSTFKINVSNSKEILSFYKYNPSNSAYQVMAAVYPTTKNANASKEMSLSSNEVSISKQDVTTKNELPGAELVIKDEAGNEKYHWTSTSTPYIIHNMKPGIYTLTEIMAPEGYELSTETITFEVKDNGETTKVVMYNKLKETPAEEIAVPSTGSYKTIVSSIAGIIVLAIGTILITKNAKKKNEL